MQKGFALKVQSGGNIVMVTGVCPGNSVDPGKSPSILSFMDHSPGFLKVVNEARPRVKEVTIEQARARLAANANAVLLDVREDGEWQNGHAEQARHLGKGVLERDLEKMFPDANTEIIMYCGGGYRSVLTCDVARRMGYENVASLIGGYKAIVQAGWPMAK
jgi:rhodanese-related sulfurtransferase